ncbi:MAG: hypothetical protein SX243_12250 [Acidobacteriota bacterium]|nr:hypothetical protein [Acidobacteriota bacterium]
MLLVLGVPDLGLRNLGALGEDFEEIPWTDDELWEVRKSVGGKSIPPTLSELLEREELAGPVLITRFSVDLELEKDAADKLAEKLKTLSHWHRSQEHAIVVLADLDPREILRAAELDDDPTSSRSVLRRRWAALLGSFTFHYALDQGDVGEFEGTIRDERLQAVRQWSDKLGEGFEIVDKKRRELQAAESDLEVNRQQVREWQEAAKGQGKSLGEDLKERIKKVQTGRWNEEQVAAELLPALEHSISKKEGQDLELEKAAEGGDEGGDQSSLETRESELHQLKQFQAVLEKGGEARQRRDGLRKEVKELLEEIRKAYRRGYLAVLDVVDVVDRECRHTAQLQRIGGQILSEMAPEDYSAFSEDKMVAKIALRARTYYHAIWSATTEDEKVVLSQLGHTGLVSPLNRHRVLDLMYRGLIIRSPALQLMNRSFALFLRQTVSKTQLLEWESEEGASVWSILRWLLPVPLLLLGGFVFITQRDVVSSALGFLLAAASVAPTLINLFGYFEQRFAQRVAEERERDRKAASKR